MDWRAAWKLRRQTVAIFAACGIVWLAAGAVPQARGSDSPAPIESGGSDRATTVPAEDDTASPVPSQAVSTSVDNLLELDIDQLTNIRVTPGARANPSAPSTTLSNSQADSREATSTGELLLEAPSTSVRRTSGINLDPRVRGYHSSQLNASANGITQLKTRLDIDSLFSQIDPGIVSEIAVIDGPYTSLYGPGFAFLVADLLPTPRFACGPEAHVSTEFAYGSNGQSLYTRDNAWGGGADWGVLFSYGLRVGNDYRSGDDGGLIPSSYNKWDGLLTLGFDVDPWTHAEFQYLRTEFNDVELPGVAYDLNFSGNDQFNLRFTRQDDPGSAQSWALQTWYAQTHYHGDASRLSKQESLYYQFFTLPNLGEFPINTVGVGGTRSLGMRLLRTFGEADAPQVTVGVDWRRAEQQYQERNLDPDGQLMFFGNVFGIPESRMDDLGALVNLLVPWSDRVSFTVGGRVDWAQASLKADDPVVTESADPAQWYFGPGFEEPNWTLGMAYATGNIRLTEQHTLNVGTGYAMRAPDLAELYTDEPYTPLVRFGNSYVNGLSTLETERNWQVDLGLDGQHDCFHYGIRGFHATINDYLALAPAFIDPAPPDAVDAPKVLGRDFSYFPPQWRQDLGTANENADTAQAGYQYVNVDMATMFGGDLSGEIQLLDWLAVFGTMAYVRGTSHRPVTFVAADSWSSPDGAQVPLGRPEALPGIYPFRGTLAVRTFDPDRRQDRWGLELGSRMVSRHNYLAESLSELGTPGYTVFHLHGYYRLREHVRLTVRINNLLDRHYTEPGSLAIIGPSGLPTFVAEPGISALIGLDARF